MSGTESDDRQRIKILFDEAFERDGEERELIVEKIIDGIMGLSLRRRGTSSDLSRSLDGTEPDDDVPPMREKVVKITSGKKMILRLPQKLPKKPKKKSR